MAKSLRSTLIRLAVAAGLMSQAFAQSSGSISGTVKDSKGGMIPAATVTVVDRAEAVNQTTHTSEWGSFIFPQLPPGTYTIAVEMAGFKKIEKIDVVRPVASKVNVGEIVLEIGNVTETVTVQAELGQLQIQSDSGERSNLVTNRQLREIALNGRNVVDMFKTVPGVIAGGTVTTSTVTNVVGDSILTGRAACSTNTRSTG